MLSRTPRLACIECNLPIGAPGFIFHAGKRSEGPAYWSDRGILCSSACALTHARRRAADGTSMHEPAPEPELERRRR
jgi:hypothetical protein